MDWSSVASGVGSVLGGLFGLSAQKSANKANMELAKYAYEKDLEMWNRNNEYNSPEKQMERLRAAGLNPNLVYGNGAVGNTSGDTPKFHAPTINPVSNGGFVSDAVQNSMMFGYQVQQAKQNVELAKTQNAVKQQEMLNTAAKTAETYARTAKTKFDLDLAKELRRYSIEAASANVDKVYSEIARNNYTAMMQEAELALMPLREKMSQAQIDQIKGAINEVYVRTQRNNWEFNQEKEGKFTGTDFWSQLGNQVMRHQRGEPSIFDTMKDPKNSNMSLVSALWKMLTNW